jgi:DNA-binding LytR/AlgR family response regulator
MKTIIIEDEQLAAERVKMLLQQIDDAIEVLIVLDSIEESVKWLENNAAPDFLILDIHLSDGSAFNIFQKIQIDIPVIFITAYDQYAISAFKVLSIDYLLKPVAREALCFSINKLKKLRSYEKPVIDYKQLAGFINKESEVYKTKFLCKIGKKSFFIFSKDISFFYADNKIVYLVCADGTKYITDHNVEEFRELLDPQMFFRANRSVIVSAAFIIMIKPYINHRLKIYMKSGTTPEEIIVSRERVADFKKWAKN